MNNYAISLALTYFKEKHEQYSISELMELIGYNRAQIDNLIYNLLENNYIFYAEGLMTLTGKGMSFLIKNNQDELCIQAESFYTPHINPSNAISIETPYIPEGFAKKYSG